MAWDVENHHTWRGQSALALHLVLNAGTVTIPLDQTQIAAPKNPQGAGMGAVLPGLGTCRDTRAEKALLACFAASASSKHFPGRLLNPDI